MNNKKAKTKKVSTNKKNTKKKKVSKKGANTTNTRKGNKKGSSKNNKRSNKKSRSILAGNDIIPFGKHKGMLVRDLPESYYNWLLNNTDVKIDRSIIRKDRKNNAEDDVKYELPYVPYTKEDKQKATAEIERIANDLDLTLYRARIIYSIRLSKINKVGDPTANDWD